MKFEDIDVRQLIPQKEPFVMVDKLLYCDETTTKTALTIKADNIFVDGGVLSRAGILENVAQTCATRIGYLTIGFIGAINNFSFSDVYVGIGDCLSTEIVTAAEVGNITQVDATVMCHDRLVAKGNMKVALMNEQ
ncbi:MAG: pseudouridylate synthase [Bacteroidetes bacterium]|nr:pseudouridylate synthase [Bacteroidota bacterium]